MTDSNGLKSFNVFASETQGYYDENYKDNPQYALGHEPLQSLPATWYNSLMRDLTEQAQATKNIVDSIYAELVSVIDAASIPLSATQTDQLLNAINGLTELQIATGSVLGGIYSSLNEWYVNVQADGTAKVNTVVATTAKSGLVQLSNAYNATSQTKAVTEKALSDGLATKQASGSYKTTQPATTSPTASGNDISFIDTIRQDTNGFITATKKTVRAGTTSQTGVVQLTNSTTSTSTTTAATPNSVKAAYDRANNPTVSVNISNGKIRVTVNGTTSTAVALPSSNVVTYAKYLVNSDNPSGTNYVTADASKNLSAHTLTLS